MKQLLALLVLSTPAFADAPLIEKTTASGSGGTWSFSVTLSHADTGWDDYADGWRILDMNGKVLGTRVLHHPHVNEQPFTRSMSGISIPLGTQKVLVEARDNVGGWSGTHVVFDLPD